MIIGSILENQKIENRIAVTPEIAKKYKALGFEILLTESYGSHLGINDKDYFDLGVKFLKDDKQVLDNSDIIVQLGILSDEKVSIIKENKLLIGVLNPYENKEKLEKLVKKNIKVFSLELLPNNQSTIYGHIVFTSKSCWI